MEHIAVKYCAFIMLLAGIGIMFAKLPRKPPGRDEGLDCFNEFVNYIG
jgi:hypothetical protein